jgi:hypothetical protein
MSKRTIELRVGMSIYYAELSQMGGLFDVRWTEDGKTLHGVGETASAAMADARSESRIAAGGANG